MSYLTRRLVRVSCSVWLAVHAAACARGDIVLGERGGTLAGADDDAPVAGASAATAGRGAAPDGDSSTPSARSSAGCGKDPPSAAPVVQLNGTRVDYLLDRPSEYVKTRAYPLLMVFRSSDAAAAQFRSQLNLRAIAGDDAIVAYANPANGASAWDFSRDMPVFSALLAKLAASHCVDPDRVFATGAGAGALFVNLLGCAHADALRAIAPLSSAPPPPPPCLGNTAVWMLQRSNTDPMVFGAGLGNRDFWAARNSCDLRLPRSVAPEPCVEYASCDPGLPVRYCEYAGDELPSFVARAVWEFFEAL